MLRNTRACLRGLRVWTLNELAPAIRQSEQLQDGLRPSMNEEDEDDELEMGVQLSARAAPRGSMSLMCPVSGMLVSTASPCSSFVHDSR